MCTASARPPEQALANDSSVLGEARAKPSSAAQPFLFSKPNEVSVSDLGEGFGFFRNSFSVERDRVGPATAG